MGHFLQALEELLPGHLHDILKWDFLPLTHLKDRHSDLFGPPLTALFEAYLILDDYLNLKTMASQDIPEDSWGCMRCGFCCTFMRPGPVTAATYRDWEKEGAPVAWFYNVRGKWKKNPVYKCWYYNGIRLRLCPFLFINRNDSMPFCSIYHMGDDFRPPVCSDFHPRHVTCRPDIDTEITPHPGREHLRE